MYYAWIMRGLCVDDVRTMHGLRVYCAWITRALLWMEYAWIMYGLCMDYAWIVHGLCMDYAWIM